MTDHPYDPRGFKARCVRCLKAFYIPWELMCDAGYCDSCLKIMREIKLRGEDGA